MSGTYDPERDVPAIATERLLLRGHALDDFDDCCAMWADPEVTRYIGGRPFSREETWARQLRYAGHWLVMRFGYWAIKDMASGRFVGEVGFADFKRDIVPSLEGTPEIGWALAPWAHGKGFATEATRAALGWHERRFGPVRTVCLISPENEPSIRVAVKCGYREWERTTYKSQPTILFER